MTERLSLSLVCKDQACTETRAGVSTARLLCIFFSQLPLYFTCFLRFSKTGSKLCSELQSCDRLLTQLLHRRTVDCTGALQPVQSGLQCERKRCSKNRMLALSSNPDADEAVLRWHHGFAQKDPLLVQRFQEL